MLKTPAGDMPANATLSDTNGKVTGTFGSQLGEVPVSGTAEGKALKLTLVAQTPQGDMTVTMTGDLDGDNIVNGKADVVGAGTNGMVRQADQAVAICIARCEVRGARCERGQVRTCATRRTRTRT